MPAQTEAAIDQTDLDIEIAEAVRALGSARTSLRADRAERHVVSRFPSGGGRRRSRGGMIVRGGRWASEPISVQLEARFSAGKIFLSLYSMD